ncbi:MAG TPA: sulfurtransferase [Anaerolineales bacterium]|nr:sulfurtransferase [Anaerolineales bacterium]
MPTSNFPHLVETDWLEAHLDDPNIRILDCTTFLRASEDGYYMESGLGLWKKAHIPGSVFADLSTDLSDQDNSIQFMIPPADKFAQAMSRLGIRDDTFVVLYDSFINIWAARVWWMLRSFGFEKAAILNGGWKKWKREKRPITTETADRPKGELVVHPNAGMIASKEDVLKAIDNPEIILIDALTRQEYSGEMAVYGRPGHIPSSINIPAIELIDRRTRSYLPVEKLEEILEPILKKEPSGIITYCGGGAAGSSVAFALKLLGVENVSVYDGALIEWASDPELPMVTS